MLFLQHDLMKQSLLCGNIDAQKNGVDETEYEQMQNKSAQLLMQLFAVSGKTK